MSDKKRVRTVNYVGTAGVGAWFGVSSRTVAKWLSRYAETHPCPEPDVLVGGAKPVPGWLPGRETEWREWEAARPTQGHGRGGAKRKP
jgi:hypothetical protein